MGIIETTLIVGLTIAVIILATAYIGKSRCYNNKVMQHKRYVEQTKQKNEYIQLIYIQYENIIDELENKLKKETRLKKKYYELKNNKNVKYTK